MPINTASSLGLTTFLSIIIDGRESAVTPIIKLSAVPIPTPLKYSASAIGIVPKMSAYIGIPITLAIITENILLSPRAL